ncbi:Trehalose/maltose import ATP-binding protein MalK [uncultured archaeon]|nr:Trehalose/maltose import ATP-binding protein MalK [uncultured archaeon]
MYKPLCESFCVIMISQCYHTILSFLDKGYVMSSLEETYRSVCAENRAHTPQISELMSGGLQSGITVKNLNAYFGEKQVLNDVNLYIEKDKITAIIGPSGCGKSTFLRCLNRMHEVVRGAKVTGEVLLDDKDIYAKGVDPVDIRRRIGIVFQKAQPFPMMTIYDDVTTGLRLGCGVKDKKALMRAAEKSLKKAALWDEVENVLYKKSGMSLSGGQQQRLCIARALAVEPDVILFDEPCSALDPISTSKIEDLMIELKEKYTLVIVTHNMQQAARVSDYTAFFLYGKLIEFGETEQIFKKPKEKSTEDYIVGRFG